jgi:hypothetical protein
MEAGEVTQPHWEIHGMKMNTKRVRLLALGGATMLAGCAAGPRPQPLYQWGTYQEQVYGYFKGESKEKQAAALEQDLAKMQAAGSVDPPGFHAHLGMLYAEIGNEAKASEQLMAERNQYPESATYIDTLLARYKK